MNRRIIPLLMLMGMVLIAQAAADQQTPTHTQIRTAAVSGGFHQSPVAVARVATGQPHVAFGGNTAAEQTTGFLFAPVDRFGRVRIARVIDYILGQSETVNPTLIDFYGNQDGRLDVADLVALINRP